MLFELKDYSASYGDIEVLHGLNLSIKQGEKIALLGRSGSGKSTLLRRLYEMQKDSCSYIPQELGLVQNLSVFHNVYMARLDQYSTFKNIRNLLLPQKEQLGLINTVLKSLDMDVKINEKVSALSGGQKQRAAIARSFYQTKSVLLADEPISALDENLSSVVMKEVSTRFETAICALHNVDVAIKHFDRVIGLHSGYIMLDKKSSELTAEDRVALYDVCE